MIIISAFKQGNSTKMKNAFCQIITHTCFALSQDSRLQSKVFLCIIIKQNMLSTTIHTDNIDTVIFDILVVKHNYCHTFQFYIYYVRKKSL